VRGFLTLKYQHASCVFLPRDAMLAQYMLSSSVRPSVRLSVRHKPVVYLSKRLDESSWYFACGLLSAYPTLF